MCYSFQKSKSLSKPMLFFHCLNNTLAHNNVQIVFQDAKILIMGSSLHYLILFIYLLDHNQPCLGINPESVPRDQFYIEYRDPI